MQHNQVLLIGYVGKDLCSSSEPHPAKRIALRVATHYTTKVEGAHQYHTVWHDVIAWDETAAYAERNFVKGSRILVEGYIEYRTFGDRHGHTRYITQIKAKTLLNLDR